MMSHGESPAIIVTCADSDWSDRFGYTAEPLASWVEQRSGVKVTTPL